jgi:dihydropteroate synthase
MFTLNCRGRLLAIKKPIVMGIINVTPDSFYSTSRVDISGVIAAARQMLKDGAAIIDIGGQSTRPGSERVAPDIEIERIIPAIESIIKAYPGTIISIDTFYAAVAEKAVEAGATIVNDVSGGSIDAYLIKTVAKLKVPYVLMHMLGDPQTMQKNPNYNNVTLEVFDYLQRKVKELQKEGIIDIIIDPGFGFGKTAEHNFQLLRELSYFRQMDLPIMVGLSRKATVYKTLNTNAEGALNGTTVLNTTALLNGASILRVHDVKEAVEAITLVSKL